MNQRKRIRVMIINSFLLVFLISGCADKTQEANGNGQSQTKPMTTPLNPPVDEAIQSMPERQLVVLFSGLLLMERRPELVITIAEATSMLPMLKKIIVKGEMTTAEQKSMLDLLTKEQMLFCYDWLDHFPEKFTGKSEDGHTFLDFPMNEERQRMIEQFKKRRKEELENGVGTNIAPLRTFPSLEGKPDNNDWLGQDKNIEQQLLELLEGKIAN